MKISTDKEKIEEILIRGVNEIIDYENLKQKLLSGKKLRVKLGIDPTSPKLHLGNSVMLLKLKDFQELGHQIVLIIGDFTGTIGDTSDKTSERPMLSEKETKKNTKDYIKQVSKILDIKKTEVCYNSKWLKKLGYSEIGMQADQFSLSDFIDRENIKRRLDKGTRVSLREVLYPLMQGYDSVAVRADIEIGGTDQRFNLLAGRRLQECYKQPPQDIMMLNLIAGTDGRKMSKSFNNTINILDNPDDMFGKLMSVNDELIIIYFEHLTRVPMEKVKEYKRQLESGINPRDIKFILAKEITKFYWGEKRAEEAEKNFKKIFQEKKAPSKIPQLNLAGKNIVEVLILGKLAQSKSEARRLILQGGVKIDEKVVRSPEEIVNKDSIVQKGKRHFLKII